VGEYQRAREQGACSPEPTGKAIPGATTRYRLEANGSISVRQGDDAPYAYVYHEGGFLVGDVVELFTYPDGAPWFRDGKREYYAIGWDNYARPIDWDTHEKRRNAPKGYSPADYW
jgi:hypothetical protein